MHNSNPLNVSAVEGDVRDQRVRRPAFQQVQLADNVLRMGCGANASDVPRVTNREPIRLLLVEDDDGDARAIERAFQKAKIAIRILRAVDGIEALEMLKGLNGRAKIPSPCILLLDLNMPRMSGLQTIKALREDKELHKSIIFVLTTSKNDLDKLAAYNLNIAGYIVKETAGRDFLTLASLMDLFWRVVEMP